MKLTPPEHPEDPTNQPTFERLYICLGACKRGFVTGCRPLIGLGGCHLKAGQTGQLLCAVGIDANNQMFPVAYAVVEGETKSSWLWFIQLLIEDIGIENQHGWTFITCKQKGLIPALEELVPHAEHRNRDQFKGKALKDKLWSAATSTTVHKLEEGMDQIKGIDKEAFKWLGKVFADEKNASEGLNEATRGRWDLKGIPCAHGVPSIWNKGETPEDHVNECYWTETNLKICENMIQPLNGPKLWSKTGLVPPFPPVYHKPPGRPPTCRRDQMNLPILPKSWGHNYRSCKNIPNREYQLKNKPRWKSLGYIRKKGLINIIPSISTNGNTKCNPNTNTNGNTKSSFGHSKRSFSNSKGTKSICIKGKFTSTKGNFCSNGNFDIEGNNSSQNQGNSNKRGKSNTNSNKCSNNKGGIITNI